MIEMTKERYLDLLADQALFGLSEEEQAELDELQTQFTEVDPEEMDRIVGLIELAGPGRDQMPAGVRDKVLASSAPVTRNSQASPTVTRSSQVSSGSSRRDLLIAVMASAATFLLGMFLSRPSEEVPLTLSEKQGVLLEKATDIVRADWKATNETKPYSGEVVWSDRMQEGYMTFRGLPVNDPAKTQYQLWIFDSNQDEKFPIDGGVFDVSDEEAIVQIAAKLRVSSPSMFAITIEKPGGVVVSDRSQLPLIAQVN